MIKRFKPGKKKCKVCPEKFDKNTNKPFQEACSIACALKLAKQKQEKKEKKNWAEQKKEMVENIMRLEDWLKKLEAVVNPIARAIDFGKPCISCDRFGKPQAGHYISVGANRSLRFNLHNIHIQDYFCNVEKSGNIIGYDEGLLRIYGQQYFQYVKFGLKNEYPSIKLSIPEVKTCILRAKECLKELLSNPCERSPQERLIMRDIMNLRIGIYDKTFEKA